MELVAGLFICVTDSDRPLSVKSPQELEREVLEVFELVRPISEQWGLPTATVSALRSADRTGTWDVFAFKRSPSGTWTHTSQTITRN